MSIIEFLETCAEGLPYGIHGKFDEQNLLNF